MFVNKSRNPSASEILSQLFLNKELRSRVLTTLSLLLLVRLGIYIPMPGIDRVAFKSFIDQGGQLIGFLDIFTGGGISTLGIFALFGEETENDDDDSDSGSGGLMQPIWNYL